MLHSEPSIRPPLPPGAPFCGTFASVTSSIPGRLLHVVDDQKLARPLRRRQFQTKLLFERGEEIGWDRVLAGVHFPSDVYGGRMLGLLAAQAMKKDAVFQERLAKARSEYDAFKAAHNLDVARGLRPPDDAHRATGTST